MTIFDDLPGGPDAGVVDLTPPAPRNGFERQPSFFVGRNLECQRIYEQLVRGARCVTILGQPGIGKTAAAARVCDYCTERRVFSAIFMVQFTGAVSAAVGDEDAACFLRRKFQAAAGLLNDGGRQLLGEKDMFRALDDIGGRERVLFAVDGIDAIATNGSLARELRSFLGRLLKGTLRVHLLTTGSTGAPVGGAYLPGNAEKVVQIRGLGERDAAMLLTARAPRKLALNEIGAERVADALACLSRHPAVRSLCGHPRYGTNTYTHARSVCVLVCLIFLVCSLCILTYLHAYCSPLPCSRFLQPPCRAIELAAPMLRCLTVGELELEAPSVLMMACRSGGDAGARGGGGAIVETKGTGAG